MEMAYGKAREENSMRRKKNKKVIEKFEIKL